MKTFETYLSLFNSKLTNNLFSETYNKVERLTKLNRTIFIFNKQYDFLYSVDWHIYLPQLCLRNHLGNKIQKFCKAQFNNY